jgi:diguanylate cyclase (GGDEF)-like protein
MARGLLPTGSIMNTVRATGALIDLARASEEASASTDTGANARPTRTATYEVVDPDEVTQERAPDDVLDQLQRENARLRLVVAELEAYRNLAYRDTLTGLWNRRYFEERLSEEISMGSRDSWRRFSLLVLDINDLKRINDHHGHATGDELIKRAGSFLRSRLREHDVCCRTGGDEYAVIVRELGAAESAQLVARLRSELRVFNGRRDNPLSLAMGTASFPDDGTSSRQLYLRADERMYADKRRGKGLVVTVP